MNLWKKNCFGVRTKEIRLNKNLFTYILYFTILFCGSLNSQDNEIGFFFGGTNYIGDVGPTTFINPFSKDNIVEINKIIWMV